MKFNVYDKYILDYLIPKIKESEKIYKETLKTEFLDVEKIFKESKTVDSEEATKLIKTKDSFVVGVNFFDNRKTDFYLLSKSGLTIPITSKNKLVIKDEELLEKELSEMGFVDAMKVELKSKDEILKSPSSYEKYRIKKNMTPREIKNQIELYTNLKLIAKPQSFFKMKQLQEEDLCFVLSKSNNFSKALFEKVKRASVDKNEAFENLQENGFLNLRNLARYKETINDLLGFMKDRFTSPLLYTKVEYEKLEMESLSYLENKDMARTFVKVTFDEKKIKQIIKKEHLESVDYIKEAEVRIGKPIKNIEEYENFLKVEEYIRKTTTKKIEMDINNIPTLDEIFDKEFNMKM